MAFTLGDRVKGGDAGSPTRVGPGSHNALLQVPKSMNWNLVLRLLPHGPEWHAVAVVACRLASRAPLEAKAEPSGPGLSTKPSASRQCGAEALEAHEAHLGTELLQPSRSTGPWIPCSRPRDPCLTIPGPVGWSGGHLEAQLAGVGFLVFRFGKGGGSAPVPRDRWHARCTTAIKRNCFSDRASSFPCFREHGGGLAKGQLPY